MNLQLLPIERNPSMPASSSLASADALPPVWALPAGCSPPGIPHHLQISEGAKVRTWCPCTGMASAYMNSTQFLLCQPVKLSTLSSGIPSTGSPPDPGESTRIPRHVQHTPRVPRVHLPSPFSHMSRSSSRAGLGLPICPLHAHHCAGTRQALTVSKAASEKRQQTDRSGFQHSGFSPLPL